MSELNPSRPPEVAAAVTLAWSGRQAEAAEQFDRLADSPDPLTAWTATAALLPWLWWHNEFAAAARRVEAVVSTFGPVASSASLPHVNGFVRAFAMAAHHDHVDIVTPLDRVLSALPEDHYSRTVLDRNYLELVSDPAALQTVRVSDPTPMLAGPTKLARRGHRRLSARDAEIVMLAAINDGHRDLVLEWMDAGVPVPTRAWTERWVAEMLIERGRVDEVEGLLVREAQSWTPFTWWETTSTAIPCGDVYRPFITSAVRRAHLEQPVAVGVVL